MVSFSTKKLFSFLSQAKSVLPTSVRQQDLIGKVFLLEFLQDKVVLRVTDRDVYIEYILDYVQVDSSFVGVSLVIPIDFVLKIKTAGVFENEDLFKIENIGGKYYVMLGLGKVFIERYEIEDLADFYQKRDRESTKEFIRADMKKGLEFLSYPIGLARLSQERRVYSYREGLRVYTLFGSFWVQGSGYPEVVLSFRDLNFLLSLLSESDSEKFEMFIYEDDHTGNKRVVFTDGTVLYDTFYIQPKHGEEKDIERHNLFEGRELGNIDWDTYLKVVRLGECLIYSTGSIIASGLPGDGLQFEIQTKNGEDMRYVIPVTGSIGLLEAEVQSFLSLSLLYVTMFDGIEGTELRGAFSQKALLLKKGDYYARIFSKDYFKA